MSLEMKLKSDYSSLFQKEDWEVFKLTADKYFELAAKLLKKDFGNEELYLNTFRKEDARLLLRNKTKRLFIGIGSELLLKAYYLKSGFHINKIPENIKNGKGNNAFKFSEISSSDVDQGDTIGFNHLIQGLNELERKINNIKKAKVDPAIINTLKIAKVFRNKEAHISTLVHQYDPNDYNEIEIGIKKMYEIWFEEELEFQISFAQAQEGRFEIKSKI